MEISKKDKFQVFLCHAYDDKPIVRNLYDQLTKDHIDAWVDEEKLLPGSDWQLEIAKAIRQSDVVLVILSNQSIKKEGYVQKELKFALEVASEKPEETIYIIPVRLENCEVPHSLVKWHWVDYFDEKGYEKLLNSFEERARKIGKQIRTLRQENELTFTCEICKEPIDNYGDEGLICLSHTELFKAMEKSKKLEKRKGAIPSSELKGTIAPWHQIHYKCNKTIDTYYEIEIYRIRTLQKLVDWTAHLMWKGWINNTDWPSLMRKITNRENEGL